MEWAPGAAKMNPDNKSANQDQARGDGDLVERVVYINRVSKVVKGGRRFSFSALAVVGDQNGKVGYALGKANEVPEAIRKGRDKASRGMIEVPIVNETIPHEALGKFGAGRVLLRPASPGTGVIAGGAVRAVMETAGVNNILTKCLRSRNPHNVIHATFNALEQLSSPEATAQKRGKTVEELGLAS